MGIIRKKHYLCHSKSTKITKNYGQSHKSSYWFIGKIYSRNDTFA